MKRLLFLIILSLLIAKKLMVAQGMRDPFFLPTDTMHQEKMPFACDILGRVQCGTAQGIIIEGSNGQEVLVQGDFLQGYQLEQIHDDHVTFIKNNQVKSVPLK